MNWKKWVGVLGFAVLVMSMSPQQSRADSYQLAVSSFTTFWTQVSTMAWTQVDTPQLVGRTSLSIYNLDASSPVYCRQDNIAPAVALTNNSTTQPTNTFTISALGTSSPPSWINMSLSNFSSNRGAYPVSVSMPVWCVSARSGVAGVLTSTVTVIQSY